MKLGIVSDFNNYKQYFETFTKEDGDKVLEIHLLRTDLELPKFSQKLIELRQFVLSRKIEKIAFHSVDEIMQSVLFEERNADKNLEQFNLLLSGLKQFSNELGKEVILIVHQGVKYDHSEIVSKTITEIRDYREELHTKAKVGYRKLCELVKDSYLVIALENSPPTCAAVPMDHIFDLCFEDFMERLGDTGAFVLDLSHAAMCIEYFKQDQIKFNALEALRDKNGNPPESLQSLDNYLKLAGKNIKWLHLNDANGILGENEGHVIGVENSLISFKKILKGIKKNIIDPVGVLEIVDSHKDYSLISQSLANLRKFSQIMIGNKVISNTRGFIVAEIASSHCGDLNKLKTIFRESVLADADAVKFQIFNASELCSTQHPGFNDLNRNQFTKQQWLNVLEYTKQFNTLVLADVFDEASADLAEPYVSAYSIHASDISNPFLLSHVARKGKPVMLYIGGSDINEIREAVSLLESYGNDIILVYGLQNFPTKLENVNLNRIKTLQQEFDLPVCYHDHTDAETSLAKSIAIHAFAFGAQMVEKHITDDRSLRGFDYMSSLNPQEFKEVVQKLREFEKILGDSKIILNEADKEYRSKMRKYIAAKRDITKGQIITKSDLAFKRVSNGQFHPNQFGKIVGRIAAVDIKTDFPILNKSVERKAVILVPVRMKSTRLPKKAILDLAGDTTIGIQLERLRQSKKAEVVLCTSILPEDSILLNLAQNKGIKHFAGHPDDVMDRFIQCAERENAEIIIRATGDNPVMDYELVDRMIDYHLENNADYTTVEEVPIGFNAEVVNLDVIKKARQNVRNVVDTEYMTWFIKDPKHFKVQVMPVSDDEKGNFRLTLDTPADLEAIRKLFEGIGKDFNVKEAVKFLNSHPEIAAINSDYQQQRLPPKLKVLTGND